MPTRRLFLACSFYCAFLAGQAVAAARPMPPNIVFILADDVGYGDFGCYGATKIKTPNIDRLAREGMRFTDAHSPSAMCTPTRYAFLTGRYAWRHAPGASILTGIAPLCIAPGTPTVASIVKTAGYATGVVGKWHLGLGSEITDYNRPLKPGPLEIGFDYAFILPATGDRVPCVYVENHDVVGYDAADPIRLNYDVQRGTPESYVQGIPRIGGMQGGKTALWSDADMADTFATKAVDFIEQHQADPFFLYFATHDIHVPRVPHPRFRGTSEAGVRGDVVQQFDATVGTLLACLDRLKLTDRTLVVVTSDNGGVLDPNGPDTVNAGTVETNNGHLPNGPLRGQKGNLAEGGHRVPFIVRWPGRTPAGTTSDQLLAHVDMLATFAALAGQTLSDDAGPDSFDMSAVFTGQVKEPVRDHLINHTSGIQGGLAVRQGNWKYCASYFSGGRQRTLANGKKSEPVKPLLYNLADDIGERKNLIDREPEKAKELAAVLEKIKSAGRSRP